MSEPTEQTEQRPPTADDATTGTRADAPRAWAADSLRDARGVLAEAVAVLGGEVARTGDDDWDRPSPCAGWTARDVVLHVVGTLTKTVGTLGGAAYAGQPKDPADAVGPADPRAAWATIAAQVEEVLPQADPDTLVPTPRGPLPVSAAIALPAADLAVHAWDLAAAGGREVDLPRTLLDHVRAITETIPPQALRSDGLFGPELPVPPAASPTEALMAWLGRARPA